MLSKCPNALHNAVLHRQLLDGALLLSMDPAGDERAAALLGLERTPGGQWESTRGDSVARPLSISLRRISSSSGKPNEVDSRSTNSLAQHRPERWFVRLLEGEIALREDRNEEAETCFRGAIEVRPSEPLPHLRLARLLLAQGELHEARAEFQASLAWGIEALLEAEAQRRIIEINDRLSKREKKDGK